MRIVWLCNRTVWDEDRLPTTDLLMFTADYCERIDIGGFSSDSRMYLEAQTGGYRLGDISARWSPPSARIRRSKVLSIRCQLQQERYDIDAHLADVLDVIIEDLFALP